MCPSQNLKWEIEKGAARERLGGVEWRGEREIIEKGGRAYETLCKR